jgi:ribonucleoside-diphosphate reductase alpha chain
MYVIKRDGRRESVQFDKIVRRIEELTNGLDLKYISPVEVAQKVVSGLYDGVTTEELDHLAAETAATMSTRHPDYGILAARIEISNLHKKTSASFSNTMKRLHEATDPKTGEVAKLVSDEFWQIVQSNARKLDEAIDYSRDFTYDYFGFKTMMRGYLMAAEGTVVERPQHMLMRVAVGIHLDDITQAIKTYHLLSEKWYTHATPTLFNAGTRKPQMSSCFL